MKIPLGLPVIFFILNTVPVFVQTTFADQSQISTNSSTDVCKDVNFKVEFNINSTISINKFETKVVEVAAAKRLNDVSPQKFDPTKDASFVKCANIKEKKGVILCIFNHMKPMNISMLRASCNSEMDIHVKDINKFFTSKDDDQSKTIQRFLGNTDKYNGPQGHDISGKKYKEFYDEYLKVTPDNNEAKIEECFDEKVLTPVVSKYGDKFFIISTHTNDYEGENKYRVNSTISHEFLHAQSPNGSDMDNTLGIYLDTIAPQKDVSLYQFLLYQTGAYPQIYSSRWLRDTEFVANILGRDSLKKVIMHKLKAMHPFAALTWKYGPYDNKELAQKILDSYYTYLDSKGIKIETASGWDNLSDDEKKEVNDKLNSILTEQISGVKLPEFDSGDSSLCNYLKEVGTEPIIY